MRDNARIKTFSRKKPSVKKNMVFCGARGGSIVECPVPIGCKKSICLSCGEGCHAANV